MKGYMEKPKMTTIDVDNFNIWYDSEDPSFTKISHESNIPQSWLSYQVVLSGKYGDSIIKPINQYVERLYPPPKLISIKDNIVRLRQENHAEFFLLEKDNGEFYNVDRPWQRQYYNTRQNGFVTPDGCFPITYKFYVPWFIDEYVSVKIEKPDVPSPFSIFEQDLKYFKVPDHASHVEPLFVPFNFRRVGSHMVTENFGKIPRKSAMFDMVFSANDIMIERVRNFYEKEEKTDN